MEKEDQITDEEKQGVEDIIYLQAMVKIEESPEDALKGWRGMSDGEKETTTYIAKQLREAREKATA